MSHILAGKSIVVLGGDRRQLFLMENLVRKGIMVTAVGFSKELLPKGVDFSTEINSVLEHASAIILPMPGIDNHGQIKVAFSEKPLRLTHENLRNIPKNVPVLVGAANEQLKQWSKDYGFKLIEIANDDQLAILNSIPTAEGALALAMNESPITLHGSFVIIFGFGRVGVTLARLSKSMGADTWVAARKPSALARASEMGCGQILMAEMDTILSRADFIFNTVPQLVLGQKAIDYLPPSAVIIDLASAPGGVDFQYAQEVGIKALLVPGLPGKVAPKTAGEMLARVIPRILSETLP
ncbi:dipicolinate synthase subunit DpsA [Metallumcola ferriviriculae]|uniref:Dipicolinate synthase subunit DpsA n=1 Tax=Metallumcola ferriviriculae TaxID=3039180 RepID=A0AAU0UPM1_9FIRM|nr:dipicolinate synthase subunit DpsA [Desulfitibacteraceae bacterium MK1]